MSESLDAEAVRRWLSAAGRVVHAEREHLTQLDAAIGDADHGVNMTRGLAAVEVKLTDLVAPPGKLLTTAGSTLVSTVGGASGPLWGTLLRRLGRTLGDEAASLLQTDSHFRLILSDVRMPGEITGIDLARMVKREWPSVRVLLTTGYVDGEAKLEDLELLYKPYRAMDLAERIQTLLQAA